MGSFTGVNGSRIGSIRRSSTWSGKPPLSALYELLIAPVEESLPPSAGNTGSAELVIVAQVRNGQQGNGKITVPVVPCHPAANFVNQFTNSSR